METDDGKGKICMLVLGAYSEPERRCKKLMWSVSSRYFTVAHQLQPQVCQHSAVTFRTLELQGKLVHQRLNQ